MFRDLLKFQTPFGKTITSKGKTICSPVTVFTKYSCKFDMRSMRNRVCCNGINLYPVLAESINIKSEKKKKRVPLPSIPDLGMTTEAITKAVGGHMTIRKWISTTNPFTNATENAFRHKPLVSSNKD